MNSKAKNIAKHLPAPTRNDLSWGRLPYAQTQMEPFAWLDASLPEASSLLPYGMGRSYGDSCINAGGSLVQTRALNRFIAFDRKSGLITCEAGVTLADILQLVVGQGWFLPVSPGTKFVTLGGAIANDVHGKNHVQAGCFGNHVQSLQLLRSDGSRFTCSLEENPKLFRATIGGLGLTGLVTQATIQLKAISGPLLAVSNTRYSCLEEFIELSHAAHQKSEYAVAWVDCLATRHSLGKGHFMVYDHCSKSMEETGISPGNQRLTLPFSLPSYAINPWSLKAFNFLYYWRQVRKYNTFYSHYDKVFYPLDAIHHWNRAYGNRGFYQYQCVVPDELSPIKKIMKKISSARAGSMLTVLKHFGPIKSPGMLSFPMPGITFALDFGNNGEETHNLLNELDKIVLDHGGRVYPAKDGRMSEASFKQYFPQWQEFEQYIDPKFSSSFWRRVTGKR